MLLQAWLLCSTHDGWFPKRRVVRSHHVWWEYIDNRSSQSKEYGLRTCLCGGTIQGPSPTLSAPVRRHLSVPSESIQVIPGIKYPSWHCWPQRVHSDLRNWFISCSQSSQFVLLPLHNHLHRRGWNGRWGTDRIIMGTTEPHLWQWACDDHISQTGNLQHSHEQLQLEETDLHRYVSSVNSVNKANIPLQCLPLGRITTLQYKDLKKLQRSLMNSAEHKLSLRTTSNGTN